MVKNINNDKQILLYNPNGLFNNILLVENLNKFILNLINNRYKSGNIVLGSSYPKKLRDIVKKIAIYFNIDINNIKWLNKKKLGFHLNIKNAISNYKFTPLKTDTTISIYLKRKY